MTSIAFLLAFGVGVLVGRLYAPRRARNALIVGRGLEVDHAMRRPGLREAFRNDRRRGIR